MDIAVGSLGKVVELALQIKEAVDTVKKNKEVCLQIATRVSRLSAILSLLDNTETMKRPEMRAALDDLEETLSRALELITDCQVKHYFSRLFTAKDLSKELHQVNQDVMDQMGIANFANGVQNTLYIQGGVHNPFQNDGAHQAPPKDAGEMKRSHSSPSTHHTRSEVSGEPEIDEAGLTVFSLSDLKALTDNFSEQSKIGSSGYAEVYKGVLPDGRTVAIKKLCRMYGEESVVGDYVIVFSVLLQHKNVVTLLGYCEERRGQLALHDGKYVMTHRHDWLLIEEYMPKGILDNFIESSSPQQKQLDWSSTFRIIRGIAQGVAHLHTKNIIHMDLKPTIVLLDSDMNPKISGFAITKILDAGETEIAEEITRGTLGYMPPEYIGEGIVSLKNDVYAYGVLLLKTISWPGLLRQDSLDWVRKAQAGEDVKELLDPRTLWDESQPPEIKRCLDIGLLCISKDRDDRPTMAEVVKMLDGKEQLPTLKRSNTTFKKKDRA